MIIKKYKFWILLVVFLISLVAATPFLFSEYLKIKYTQDSSTPNQFPVTVDPINKTIIQDEEVEAYFQSPIFNAQALAFVSTDKFEEIFSRYAVFISEIVGSENLAMVSGQRIVTIHPGLRKEEVASRFAKALGWNETKKKEFLSKQADQNLPLDEGSFFPGVYVVSTGATPQEVQYMVNERFIANVLSRYGETTSEVVSLEVALTVASLIQRETIGTDDMRMVSGIIWNRIFENEKLQLDATLQYVKASKNKNGIWWPPVRPQDKFIKSAYNTYINRGLPPTPIANPSVAALMAALNPIKTECMFYFHDKKGGFHCAQTYKEHVALLKQYYGQGR
jgi:uncharacterized YceG family protein